MEYVYAALLLHKAKKKVDEPSIKKVLEAAGVTVEPAQIKALVAALDGVNIEEVIKQAPVAAAAPVAAPAGDASPKEEEPEEKEEEKTEAAAEGLGALFG